MIILIVNISCSGRLHEKYRGYVYSLKKEPLHNVKVYEWTNPTEHVCTQKNGYFLLNPRSLNFVDDLIFEKEGYVTDTVYSYSANRRGDKTHFLTNRSDTVFMKKKTNK